MEDIISVIANSVTVSWRAKAGQISFKKSSFLFWLLFRNIIYEHVHRLELRIFFNLGCCGNVASVRKTPFISYLCIFFILDVHVCN